MAIYLDCNATTPIEPDVLKAVIIYMKDEFGNAGSRTHEFGAKAKQAVQKARDQIAIVVKAKREEVIFTSGATESNNLAILGLAHHCQEFGKKHVISTMIEHKSVLEPLDVLKKRGFEVTLLQPNKHGFIDPTLIKKSLRADTAIVSVMHVNNETGVVQPINEIAQVLQDHEAYFHVDAAQSFGKILEGIDNRRVDLISISGHKIYAPKGIGALIVRRREFKSPPIEPLLYGGGQERGLRPGTLPVHLIVGLGVAADIAVEDHEKRILACKKIKNDALNAFMPLFPIIHGDQKKIVPHTISLAFPGLDSEAVIVALKDEIAISNGSACTSHSYQPSHVLKAMQIRDDIIQGTIRISWCHMTENVNWTQIVTKLKTLQL